MIIKKIYLLATLFIFVACSLEHNIVIDMKDSGYTVNYTQSRDTKFIPFLYPADLGNWAVIDSSEIELHFQRAFNYNDIFPSLFTIEHFVSMDEIPLDMKNTEIILKEPYQISSSNLFILRNYQFEGIFKGRRVKNNYDKLINYYSGFMDDAELVKNGDDISEKKYDGIDAICNQLIGFLYIEVINNSSIEFNQKGIYLNALKEWKNKSEITALINEDKIGLDGEQLSKILDRAEEYLYEIVEDSYADEIKELWKKLRLEIYGTLFLLFNDFYLQVNMPGNHIQHNADSVYQNTLLWDVDVDRFMDHDFTIFAKSRVFNKNRAGLLLLIAFIMLTFIIKRKYSKN